jgi:hypothetical protein
MCALDAALVFVAANTNDLACKAAGAAQVGRMGAAEQRSLWAGARSAHRDLTCRTLSEHSERSERSVLCGTARRRVAQGTRSEAKGQPSEPRLRRARRLAPDQWIANRETNGSL